LLRSRLKLSESMPASCALSQRNTHGATARTVPEIQLHDMIRSASLSDKDIANVVNCSTRTVRSARANYRNFGNVSAPNNVGGRRSSIPSHVLTALLDHLFTKPDLYLDEIVDFVWDQYELVISIACLRRSLKAYNWSKKKNQ
jgi:transposase